MDNYDDKPKTNIFGIVVNTDAEMEEKPPSLDVNNENEIEQVGFNPFLKNIYDTEDKKANLRVGDLEETKESLEIFDITKVNQGEKVENEEEKN